LLTRSPCLRRHGQAGRLPRQRPRKLTRPNTRRAPQGAPPSQGAHGAPCDGAIMRQTERGKHVMLQAIVTKYHGPTNYKGSRISARARKPAVWCWPMITR
jgi:hypothetical protein